MDLHLLTTMSTKKSINGNGPVAIIAAIGSLATTIGTVIVIVISASQSNTLQKVEKQAIQQTTVLKQVELQGNSVALEQKRVTAAALRTAAAVTKLPADELKAADAEKVYSEALKQAELNAR